MIVAAKVTTVSLRECTTLLELLLKAHRKATEEVPAATGATRVSEIANLLAAHADTDMIIILAALAIDRLANEQAKA